jgi:hypothetical protein
MITTFLNGYKQDIPQNLTSQLIFGELLNKDIALVWLYTLKLFL